jgi:hypothetical protein
MAERQQLNIDVDPSVAEILRKLAAEAHLSEGEIVDRAVRTYDIRTVLGRIRSRSDLDEDQAMALAREELKAVRAGRRAA